MPDEKKEKVTNRDEHRSTEPEEFELDNFQVCMIRQSKSVNALMTAIDIPKKAKLKIYNFFFSIMDDPKAKAVYKAVDEVLAEFVAANPEAPPVMMNDPMFNEIYEQKSGIKITKLQLTAEDIPDALSPADMVGLSWLINFNAEL